MIEPGIHSNIRAADYHRRELGVVSKSALDRVHRSPAHYRAWIDGTLPEKESEALSFGRAFHMALLEPDRYSASYIEIPKFKGEGSVATKKAWLASHADHEHITLDDMLTIGRMVDAVHSHPLAKQMVRNGKAELTLSWKDQWTGLSCKSRLDFYVEELAMIVDAKSTDDARWEAFRKDVAKYGYARQDALYRAAALALDLPIQHFVLLAVEKSEPYAVATYTLNAEGVGRGYSSVRADIDRLAECMRTNKWPGYPETIQEIEVPWWSA